MVQNKKGGERHQLLEGHKRVGKRFIPPMKQIPFNTSVSYVNDMLPELLWIGLINDRVGYVAGARIIEKVFLAVDAIKDKGQQGNFALMSCFNCLTSGQKSKLIVILKEKGVLDTLQDAVAPLVLLYDECPIRFFGPPNSTYSHDKLITRVKECVGKTINRYETPAIVLYGAMLLARLATKMIKFPADMKLPNFNSVITAPDSDEAKHAAGFMRASGLGEFGMIKPDPAWAKRFWNHNYEISPCEIEQHEY